MLIGSFALKTTERISYLPPLTSYIQHFTSLLHTLLSLEVHRLLHSLAAHLERYSAVEVWDVQEQTVGEISIIVVECETAVVSLTGGELIFEREKEIQMTYR